jgi:hypothetical protein
MRPQSIILFERIYLTCVALGAVAGTWSFLHVGQMMPPGAPPALTASLPLISGVSLVAGVAINLLLWFFIARRGANVAKWIFIVFFVLGLFGLVRMVMGVNTLIPGLMRVSAAIQLVLQAACAWLVFRPDARAWFKGERPNDLHDIFS